MSRWVATGAMLATLAAPLAAAQEGAPLGRLFTTPAERTTLDELRYQAQFAPPEPEPEPQAPQPEVLPPQVSRLTVDGIVKRSRGPSSVWLNGTLVERGGRSPDGIEVGAAALGPDGVRIRLPSGADTLVLKPGQQIDVTTGAVVEAYERAPAEGARSVFEPAPAGAPAAAAPVGPETSPEMAIVERLEALRDTIKGLPEGLGR